MNVLYLMLIISSVDDVFVTLTLDVTYKDLMCLLIELVELSNNTFKGILDYLKKNNIGTSSDWNDDCEKILRNHNFETPKVNKANASKNAEFFVSGVGVAFKRAMDFGYAAIHLNYEEEIIKYDELFNSGKSESVLVDLRSSRSHTIVSDDNFGSFESLLNSKDLIISGHNVAYYSPSNNIVYYYKDW